MVQMTRSHVATLMQMLQQIFQKAAASAAERGLTQALYKEKVMKAADVPRDKRRCVIPQDGGMGSFDTGAPVPVPSSPMDVKDPSAQPNCSDSDAPLHGNGPAIPPQACG